VAAIGALERPNLADPDTDEVKVVGNRSQPDTRSRHNR
jgi:hypothetical protein